MTHFVAVWAPPHRTLDVSMVSGLRSALEPAGKLDTVATPRVAIAQWDSGLWPWRAMQRWDGRGIVIAGDPVVVTDVRTLEREPAIARLGDRLLDAACEAGCEAEGTYAAMAWSEDGAATVITDKLGVRPLYWARLGDNLVVSTALWAIARVPGLRLSPDLRGALETCAFGAPLADRTLVAGVQALGAGELIDLTGSAPVVRRYHDWATLPPTGVPERELAAYIADAFDQAVRSRIVGQRRVFAFLSGGMDSRLVVARLRHHGVDVSAMNFAPPGSQDLLYGQLAARAMDVKLFEFDDDGTTFLSRRGRAFDAWGRDPANVGLKPDNDRLVWSGDGGSVALGHVYVTEAIVQAARERGADAAAREIQRANNYTLSPRSLARAHRDMALMPLAGIAEDLKSRTGVEPGRNAHLFFMLNDQRRHMVAHYETLHETRLDLVLPFFDGRFLKAVLASPIDPFLLHRLYNRIMADQPFGLGQVPWQVYPGHEACPAPVDETARLQWQEGWFEAKRSRQFARTRVWKSLRFVLSPQFPSNFLSRPALAGAALAGLAGAMQYEYLLLPIGPIRQAMDLSAH